MKFLLLIVCAHVASARMEKYGKNYDTLEEETFRRGVFEKNLAFVEGFRSEDYTVAMNSFGDLLPEEFAAKGRASAPAKLPLGSGDIPPSKDWRTTGCTGSVMNQGQCGNVWMFASFEMIQSCNCIKHNNTFVALSIQDLQDCSGPSPGCQGGLPGDTLEYCVKNGIDTLASYPPTPQPGPCKHTAEGVGARCVSYGTLPAGNETALTEALAYSGTVVSAIDASRNSFQFYNSGVYSDPLCSSTSLDHAMLNLGYGDLGGKAYYILQNSWGTSWGMAGYMLLARNKHNMCGVATAASYVVMP